MMMMMMMSYIRNCLNASKSALSCQGILSTVTHVFEMLRTIILCTEPQYKIMKKISLADIAKNHLLQRFIAAT
jgi:hypothetical protein